MKLRTTDIQKLENFLKKIKLDTYPEPISALHTNITRQMFKLFIDKYQLPPQAKILDIGCGQGVALEMFTKNGFEPIGITLNPKDLAVCRQQGYQVLEMDQSFLDFEDESFDFVWCRHCIEHSIFPYFTLSEIYRVIKPLGYLYIEVPMPETSCKHQANQNHYSVLGKPMWLELVKRTGFKILDVLDINFTVPAGPDTYCCMIQQKPKLS